MFERKDWCDIIRALQISSIEANQPHGFMDTKSFQEKQKNPTRPFLPLEHFIAHVLYRNSGSRLFTRDDSKIFSINI